MLTRQTAKVALLVAAVASTACVIDVQGEGVRLTEEKRFPASGEVNLSLRTFDGRIEVRGWDGSEVIVRIERAAATEDEAKALEVRTTQKGNQISVEAVEPRRQSGVNIGWNSPSVSLLVQVPKRGTINARTGDGSIDARDLGGIIALQTGDGSIRADRLEGQVTSISGDGSIAIADSRGTFDVQTGDGSVDLTARIDGLNIRTGDGSVHVDAAEGSAMKGDWNVTTGDGAVAITIPRGLNADVEASSGDGRISTNWAGAARANGDDDDQQSFRGRLGSGGRTLQVRTGDGSVQINQR